MYYKGFTLIEIIVVIAIIAILASIVAVNSIQYLAKSRNTKRVNDIENYIITLNSYYLHYYSYPPHTGDVVSSAQCLGICATGNKCTSPINTLLIQYGSGSFGDFNCTGGNFNAYSSTNGYWIMTSDDRQQFGLIYYLEGTNQPCGPAQESTNILGTTQCIYFSGGQDWNTH